MIPAAYAPDGGEEDARRLDGGAEEGGDHADEEENGRAVGYEDCFSEAINGKQKFEQDMRDTVTIYKLPRRLAALVERKHFSLERLPQHHPSHHQRIL
jgi:hypothetical protein